MKLKADSRGRLAAMDIFRPGTVFDVSPQPDGSIRVIELVEKEMPVVPVKFNPDGSFECPPLMSRETIRVTLRAERAFSPPHARAEIGTKTTSQT